MLNSMITVPMIWAGSPPTPFTLPLESWKLMTRVLSLMMNLLVSISNRNGEFALSKKKHLGWLVSMLSGVGMLVLLGIRDSIMLWVGC